MVGRDAAQLNLAYIHKQFDKGHRGELYDLHFKLEPIKDQWLATFNMKMEETKVSGKEWKKLQAMIVERRTALSQT